MDILSFALGMNAGKASGGGGGSSEGVIFAEQTISNFAPNETLEGVYLAEITPPPFRIEEGKEYIVKWDGTEYTVKGQDASSFIPGFMAIGNGTFFGLEGNNEPFAVATGESGLVFISFDTKTSHRVKIYQKTGSSGGGGSLPAGAYCSAYPVKRSATSKRHRYFKLNGELYAQRGQYASNGNLYAILKYSEDSGTWTEILTASGTSAGLNGNGLFLDCDSFEFKGKRYFYRDDNEKVWAFDGTTFVNTITLPAKGYGHSICVFKDEIYFYSDRTGTVYKYEEASNTWTTLAVIGATSDYYFLFATNEAIYAKKSKIIYRYENGNMTQIGTSQGTDTKGVVYNNKLYIAGSYAESYRIFCYDFSTNTEKVYSGLPLFSDFYWIEDDDKLSATVSTVSASNTVSSGSTKCPSILIHLIDE